MSFPESRRLAARGLARSLLSPLVGVAVLVAAATTIALERAIAALADSVEVRSEVVALAARLAGEAAADAFVQSNGGESQRAIDTGSGLVVRTEIASVGEGRRFRLTANVEGQRFDYSFQRLEGGNALALGRALTIAPGVGVLPEWLEVNEAVREAVPEFAEAPPSDPDQLTACGLVLDAGVALQHLPAGTDAPDYSLGCGRSASRPKVPASGAVHVLGNLWLDAEGPPLELHLRRDLTVVVHGNLYLGRGVSVRGSGALTFAVRSDRGTPFVDRDANGRFGPGDDLVGKGAFAGPIEGAGNVYLGLPPHGAERIELQAGLVVEGVIHVAAAEARVHGPVAVAGAGARLCGREGRLVCTGLLLPGQRRGTLPGFATVGAPRPSQLLPLEQEPLYAAAPPR